MGKNMKADLRGICILKFGFLTSFLLFIAGPTAPSHFPLCSPVDFLTNLKQVSIFLSYSIFFPQVLYLNSLSVSSLLMLMLCDLSEASLLKSFSLLSEYHRVMWHLGNILVTFFLWTSLYCYLVFNGTI